MTLLGAIVLAVGLGRAAAPPGPGARAPDAALVFWNARLALREGQPAEALRLWLLRNTMEARTGMVSAEDAHFRSAAWAALSGLGLCSDGLPPDSDGAALYGLVRFNEVVRAMGRRPPASGLSPFDAFSLGQQQRAVAIGSVLDAAELGAVRFGAGRCASPRLTALRAGLLPTDGLADRALAAQVLRAALVDARAAVEGAPVRGRAVLDARLLDLDLTLMALAERAAAAQARERARDARAQRLSPEAVAALLRADAPSADALAGEAGAILRGCAQWPIGEWLTLDPDRRRFLFDRARAAGVDAAALDAVALGVLDAMVAAGDGAEAAAWVARATEGRGPGQRAAVWAGPRGAALAALGPSDGFRGQAALALHRGVGQLAAGDRDGALRELARALHAASDAPDGDAVAALARRWVAYAAGRHRADTALIEALRGGLPRRDFGLVVEALLWRAALLGDVASHGALRAAAPEGIAARLAWLVPLAAGDTAAFDAALARGLREAPSGALRFVDALLDHIEAEEQAVRAAQVPVLRALRGRLRALGAATEGRLGAQAEARLARVDALLDGAGASAGDPARAWSPDAGVFAGAVRLAPTDPLPWPFPVVPSPAPSPFVVFGFAPEEWWGPDGALVYGWRVLP